MHEARDWRRANRRPTAGKPRLAARAVLVVARRMLRSVGTVGRRRPLASPRRWCVALLADWTAVWLFAAQVRPSPRDELDCTFLSVGHGCAAVLSLPDGSTVLYDAGQLGSPTASARSISSFLWSRGAGALMPWSFRTPISTITTRLPELLRRFSVGAVYVSPVMFDGGGAAVEALRKAIDAAGVPLREIFAGDRLHAQGDCALTVLHPPAHGTLGSDNSNSVVLEVDYRGRRLLLPGDLESPGLDELLAEDPVDCDVVLAPHHGSAQSDPPGFVAWTTPEWTIISGDSRSNRPEVADAYRPPGGTCVEHLATRRGDCESRPDGSARHCMAASGCKLGQFIMGRCGRG